MLAKENLTMFHSVKKSPKHKDRCALNKYYFKFQNIQSSSYQWEMKRDQSKSTHLQEWEMKLKRHKPDFCGTLALLGILVKKKELYKIFDG
jgi:hypothetical protein